MGQAKTAFVVDALLGRVVRVVELLKTDSSRYLIESLNS